MTSRWTKYKRVKPASIPGSGSSQNKYRELGLLEYPAIELDALGGSYIADGIWRATVWSAGLVNISTGFITPGNGSYIGFIKAAWGTTLAAVGKLKRGGKDK